MVLLLVISLILIFFSSNFVSDQFDLPSSFRLSGTVITFIILISFITLSLGAFGLLHWKYLLFTSALITIPFLTKRNLSNQSYLFKNFDRHKLFAFLGLAVFHCCQYTYFSFDDKQYHALNPAIWIQNGIINLEHTIDYTGYYFFNSVLFDTFIMTFTRGNYDLFWVKKLLFSIILFELLIIICKSSRSGLTAAIFLFFILLNPSYSSYNSFFNSPEISSAPYLIFCGLLFGHHLEKNIPRRIYIFLGTVLGFIAGFKVTILLFQIPLIAAIMIKTFKRKTFLSLLGFLAPFAITSSYWFFNTWLSTGNPFFPFEIFDFPFIIGKDLKNKLTLLSLFNDIGYSSLEIHKFLGSRATIKFLTLTSIFFMVKGLIKHKEYQKEVTGLTLITLGILLHLILYPFIPNSGRGEDLTIAYGSFNRFFIIIKTLATFHILNLINLNEKKVTVDKIIFILMLFVTAIIAIKNLYLIPIAIIILIAICYHKRTFAIPLSGIALVMLSFLLKNKDRSFSDKFLSQEEKTKVISLYNNYKVPAFFYLGKNFQYNFKRINQNGEIITPLHKNKNLISQYFLFPSNIVTPDVSRNEYLKSISELDSIIFEQNPPHIRNDTKEHWPQQLSWVNDTYTELPSNSPNLKHFKIKKN